MSGMPSGWFPNPSNPREEVYWDGERWTGEVRSPGADATISDAAPGEASALEQSGVTAASDGSSDSPAVPQTVPVQVEQVAPQTKQNRRLRLTGIAVAVVAVLLAGGITTGIVLQNTHNQEVAMAKHKAAVAKAEKQAAAEAAQEAKDAQDTKDAAERARRAAAVVTVQASIKKMAEDDISKGLLDGPVLGVTCNPVNGGSTDDLTDITTAFDCFVSNKDNGDGTQSGYFFNATMNWSTGSYTFGLGKSQ